MKKRLLFTICFVAMVGFSMNSVCAETFSIQELNRMRAEKNLPMLTGDPSIDIQYLSRECNSGIPFACTLLPSLQRQLQQQGYQNPNAQIIPLPPLEDTGPRYQPQGNYGGIRPLPPIDASPEEVDRWERNERLHKLNEMNARRGEAARDAAQAEREAQDHQNRLNRIDRMFAK